MGINSVNLSGNLGSDPEIRYLDSGTQIASFSLAVNGYKKRQKTTIWVSCKAFNKTAELVGEYCSKGKTITVSGKLDEEKWQDQNGNSKSKFVVLVNDIQLPQFEQAEEF